MRVETARQQGLQPFELQAGALASRQADDAQQLPWRPAPNVVKKERNARIETRISQNLFNMRRRLADARVALQRLDEGLIGDQA